MQGAKGAWLKSKDLRLTERFFIAVSQRERLRKLHLRGPFALYRTPRLSLLEPAMGTMVTRKSICFIIRFPYAGRREP